MVAVGLAPRTKFVFLVGEGISVSEPVQISNDITITNQFPSYELNTESDILKNALLFAMSERASAGLVIKKQRNNQDTLRLAWNNLWTFKLVSLSCSAPFHQLFSVAQGNFNRYELTTREPLSNFAIGNHDLSHNEIDWIIENFWSFWEVMGNNRFAHALRYLANSYHLRDPEAALMLIWAGIERLVGTDAELRYRVSAYATILSPLDGQERESYFSKVKKAYDFRSRVVHGSVNEGDVIRAGLDDASTILYNLLRRCVELGRVPDLEELDRTMLASRL